MTDADSLIPGVVNFRDTGGLPAGDRVTRHGVLFRSGNLAALDADDIAAVRALGLQRIIDLRDDREVVRDRSLTDELGLTTQRAPLHYGSVSSFFERDVSLGEFYRILLEESGDALAEIVRGVLAEHPVLIHCTIGKDRTGVTVAVLLAAVGVDAEAVAADYARSEGLLPVERTRAIAEYVRRAYPDARHLEALANSSPIEAMRDLLAEIVQRYGSVRAFLGSRGVSDDELDRLREVLLAPAG